MPVVQRRRRVLRGIVRAQTRAAIKTTEQLRRAWSINQNLLLFNPDGHTGDTGNMEFIINLWRAALDATEPV
jgi:hypothetical protein